MFCDQNTVESTDMDAQSSSVWQNCIVVPDTPAGFTMKAAVSAENPNGHETMLEVWEAGTAEPPHSHGGDDMTVVVEGQMEIQFFTKDAAGTLCKDGTPLILNKGDVGYIAAGRIHDAKYIQPCKLVYVHNRAFSFHAH